ncbi:hypothetical protein AUO94_08140 [Planococcus kocurii]|uniref:Uncharacterized protein n=2 Tax=Planococcus kocurii TaxID=1374 RepID=A0ABM5WWC6_9BACL|nr:hypothetical protein AUO94_08140 [Planococcus kocurii]
MKEQRADKVLVVIATNGMGNFSSEYMFKNIHEMSMMKKNQVCLEIIFHGANSDTVDFHVSAKRTQSKYSV